MKRSTSSICVASLASGLTAVFLTLAAYACLLLAAVSDEPVLVSAGGFMLTSLIILSTAAALCGTAAVIMGTVGLISGRPKRGCAIAGTASGAVVIVFLLFTWINIFLSAYHWQHYIQ